MTKDHHHLDTLHPMGSFGVVSGLTQQIRITRLEKRLNPAVPFPHKHNFYHLVFITQGKGWHEIDFKRHEVKGGAFFFMIPAQVHSWSMSKDTKGVIIEFEKLQMFSGDEAYVVAEGLAPARDYLVFTGEMKKSIQNLCENLLEEYEEEKKDFEVILRLRVAELILLFNRTISSKAKSVSRVSKFREDFNDLIEKNYKQEHSAEFYSRTLGLTPKALTAKVKRIIGKNVRDLIQERCILESKRLLAYSDLSVAEIGLELGFLDPNYFTRFFKSKVKINPGKFRQKVRTLC